MTLSFGTFAGCKLTIVADCPHSCRLLDHDHVELDGAGLHDDDGAEGASRNSVMEIFVREYGEAEEVARGAVDARGQGEWHTLLDLEGKKGVTLGRRGQGVVYVVLFVSLVIATHHM